VVIEETEDYQPFWQILTANLQARYGLNPVHTLEEITLLHQRFPQHIRLFVAKEGNETIGGSVFYISNRVVHSQYIAASPRGREVHALDLLFDVVIRQSLEQHAYFDFGISTENQGTYLNQQLIYQKEGFGGRGVCYDWYKWTL
jgi:predicted N-acyltransferase